MPMLPYASIHVHVYYTCMYFEPTTPSSQVWALTCRWLCLSLRLGLPEQALG